MPKYFLSFHTIFILNENIDYLEDFLKYYINLGFEHFYLYDNNGSAGYGSTSTHNRYGFPASTTNSEESEKKFAELVDKYPGKITRILWQPRDYSGRIVYAQPECVKHFIRTYGHENTWTAFMDLDEYLFSPSRLNIIDYLRSLDTNIKSIRILQKKFVSLQLSNCTPAYMDHRCVNYKPGPEWAPKWIGYVPAFSHVNGNIHQLVFNEVNMTVDPEVLRFNHYNTNAKQLDWMTSFYNSPIPFTLDGEDRGMEEQYGDIFPVVRR